MRCFQSEFQMNSGGYLPTGGPDMMSGMPPQLTGPASGLPPQAYGAGYMLNASAFTPMGMDQAAQMSGGFVLSPTQGAD